MRLFFLSTIFKSYHQSVVQGLSEVGEIHTITCAIQFLPVRH